MINEVNVPDGNNQAKLIQDVTPVGVHEENEIGQANDTYVPGGLPRLSIFNELPKNHENSNLTGAVGKLSLDVEEKINDNDQINSSYKPGGIPNLSIFNVQPTHLEDNKNKSIEISAKGKKSFLDDDDDDDSDDS